MADGNTPAINLIKPEDMGSAETWGYKWNDNFDKIDLAIGELNQKSGYPIAEFGRYLAAFTDLPLATDTWNVYAIDPTPFYDPLQLVSIGNNTFQVASNGGLEWDVTAFVRHDTVGSWYPALLQSFVDFRLFNVTDNQIAARSFRGHHTHLYATSLGTNGDNPSGMEGTMVAHCTGGGRVIGGKTYRFEMFHRRVPPSTGTRWYAKWLNNTPGLNNELVFRVQYWRD